MRKYFYKLLLKYFTFYVTPTDSIIEINPQNTFLFDNIRAEKKAILDLINNKGILPPSDRNRLPKADYIILNGNIHYERDIQWFLDRLHELCRPETRILIAYYSSLWKPIFKFATWIKIRGKAPEQNWIAHEDIENLLFLANFQLVSRQSRCLFPIWIPLLSFIVNRFISPLPFFNIFNMLHIAIARPLYQRPVSDNASVSVVVPARNEEGNIENIVRRIPPMGKEDEIIFIEGHSNDHTWEKIQEVKEKYQNIKRIITAKQEGKGKGDAVRKGFALATKEILMILDADITVEPEELPKFYRAIVNNGGEFINGSRLVYPMQGKAMRFLNMIGNKFFALAFSYVLGQRFKDTLCGTKALTRANYLKIARNRFFFGNFDPFGDFDLIFGAARRGLKIVELPIAYRERVYGKTNISRWRHGAILLGMLFFAIRKIKFY